MSLFARCQTCTHRSVDRCRKVNRHINVMDARGEPCPLDLPPKSGKPRILPAGATLKPPAAVWNPDKLRVSVVIISHNYGRYLAEAIGSVLGQTRSAYDILIVDDASTDETPQIAAAFSQFADSKIRYERVEFLNVYRCREFGLQQTEGEVLLFLDADNRLPENYLEGVALFDQPNVGVVYPDLRKFGDQTSVTNFPEFDRGLLFRDNFVDAGSLIRRDALEQSDTFRHTINPSETSEDWFLFKRLAAARWQFRKQSAKLGYRIHDEQCSKKHIRFRTAPEFYRVAGLHLEPLTIFIPLSGRRDIWNDEMAPFLTRQTWPRDQCRLILFDSSQDAEFSADVRAWIARCDYSDVRHVQRSVAEKGLSDRNRRTGDVERHVQQACCRIYNFASSAIETDFVWILEDDVIPPDNAAEIMFANFEPDVGTVSIPYESRYDPDYVVWGFDGRRVKKPTPPAVKEVHGTGFGCILLRAELLRNYIFAIPPGERWYDPTFFKLLDRRWRRLLDWRHEARHHGARLYDRPA